MARFGLNVAANIVPSCATCNMLKHVATEREYVALMTEAGTQGWLPPAAQALLTSLARLPVEPREVTMVHQAMALGERRTVPNIHQAVLVSPPAITSYASYPAREDWVMGGSATPVAGISHRAEAVAHVVGSESQWGGWGYLEPDPKNPHDPMAVRVRVGGQFVGFLPKTVAAHLSGEVAGLWRSGQLPVVRTWLWTKGAKLSGRVHLEQPPRIVERF